MNVCGAAEVPKSRLESEQHQRVPWPMYSRKLTFRHSRPCPFFMIARVLNNRLQSRVSELEGVDFWPKLSNLEVAEKKHA